IIEPTCRIVGCPLVQLGLDPQYPCLRLPDRERRPRRAGVHQRPPGLPVLRLRACCRPSPCGRLSRPPSTTAAPPPCQATNRPPGPPPPASPPADAGPPRRRAGRTAGRATRQGFPCSPPTGRRGRRPAFPRQPRH